MCLSNIRAGLIFIEGVRCSTFVFQSVFFSYNLCKNYGEITYFYFWLTPGSSEKSNPAWIEMSVIMVYYFSTSLLIVFPLLNTATKAKII